MFLLKILLNLLSLGKCLSINVRKVFATFVATLMLKGGLNQVIFRSLELFFSLFLSVHVLSNCRFVLYPFFFRASVYGAPASLNIWAFLELVDRDLCFLVGSYLFKVDGYFVFEYCCLVFFYTAYRCLFSDTMFCLESLQLFYWLQ